MNKKSKPASVAVILGFVNNRELKSTFIEHIYFSVSRKYVEIKKKKKNMPNKSHISALIYLWYMCCVLDMLISYP